MPTPVFEPPEGYSPANLKKGAAWCPYCGRETPFGWDGRLDYVRCVECGISERDFYVRKFNGLWKDAALDAFIKGVRKSKRKYDRPFPWEKENQAEVALPERPCITCGETFAPSSNRQKYCENCGDEIRREQRKQSVYRSRAKQRLSEGIDLRA